MTSYSKEIQPFLSNQYNMNQESTNHMKFEEFNGVRELKRTIQGLVSPTYFLTFEETSLNPVDELPKPLPRIDL